MVQRRARCVAPVRGFAQAGHEGRNFSAASARLALRGSGCRPIAAGSDLGGCPLDVLSLSFPAGLGSVPTGP